MKTRSREILKMCVPFQTNCRPRLLQILYRGRQRTIKKTRNREIWKIEVEKYLKCAFHSKLIVVRNCCKSFTQPSAEERNKWLSEESVFGKQLFCWTEASTTFQDRLQSPGPDFQLLSHWHWLLTSCHRHSVQCVTFDSDQIHQKWFKKCLSLWIASRKSVFWEFNS